MPSAYAQPFADCEDRRNIAAKFLEQQPPASDEMMPPFLQERGSPAAPRAERHYSRRRNSVGVMPTSLRKLAVNADGVP
jgi:hypothetical protein